MSMLKSATVNVVMGAVAGMLLSATSLAVAGNEDDSHYLLDTAGKPVLSSRKDECLKTPTSPNTPKQVFVECGDITDRDGDGVPDDKDDCPDNTKEELVAGVEENGCPKDSDKDGVPDYRDDCPNNTAREISKGVDSRGCPRDDDEDGVPNYRDHCPGTPPGARVNEFGCAETDKVVRDILGSDVSFKFDSAKLLAAGKATLNRIAGEILAEEAYVVEVVIVGHTDSSGPQRYNQKLSERRAKSVADYLIAKGVPAAKVKQMGKGELEPVASNKTRAGRKQNRRVVIDVGMSK